ncbi:hypothetical protein SPRG_14351 [Saprolegnia parasitica CBS 223.65]|uniref:Uncharacterized protein n=1 Tax=Saprolegnia parasitica (strain CBS 223.65) TaxID=695850 RepID=A0A067BQ74_SAPPC|nr:hypothetical protein SPRG_14351 [Saprolegnia parasitica CBS 223.65]KDO20413.1 hypothetical protein SPRG_14351 [Saprolegnia parasitica CBS 223.65]|eukprot:XP_012208869.1 hypothetical protein SPRG_14351 [Saprolegnia parasitica CBS 223.65]
MHGLLAVVLALIAVVADGAIISGLCNDKNTSTPLVKGDQTYICINVNDMYRAVFTPTVDDYVQLRMYNSYSDNRIVNASAASFLTLSSMTSRSVYKLYADVTGRAFPTLTAIITVANGIIQGISWDDGCYLCDAASCMSNLYASPKRPLLNSAFGDGSTCYMNRTTCTATDNACDLGIYVGWTGTDYNGNYLSSAGMRVSQFQAFSVSSYVSDLKNKLSTLLPRF